MSPLASHELLVTASQTSIVQLLSRALSFLLLHLHFHLHLHLHPILLHLYIMARFPITAAIAATGAAAVQVPLQNPLMNPSLVQEPIEYEKLPLVDSEVLQERISSWNLEARSQVLYQIAQLSQEEYNHPTRVIGSKGTSDQLHRSRATSLTSFLKAITGLCPTLPLPSHS